MKFDNFMILEFPSKSTPEAFARSAVAAKQATALRAKASLLDLLGKSRII